MQLRDDQAKITELDSSDLTHFTFKQTAAMWSAILKMQRKAYTVYQSRHAQQLQQEQSELMQNSQMSSSDEEIEAGSIQLSDTMPISSALSEFSPASP